MFKSKQKHCISIIIHKADYLTLILISKTLRAMFVPINVTDVKQNEQRFLKFFFMFCVCILRSLYKIMDVFLH